MNYLSESSPGLWYLEFLLGLHYVDMINRFIGHMFELSLSPPLFPRDWVDIMWLKAPNPLNLFCLCGVTSPASDTSFNINSPVVQEVTMNKKDSGNFRTWRLPPRNQRQRTAKVPYYTTESFRVGNKKWP